jgi:hypothetical protein
MAIVQISQIQIRRGLQQDLPQLASAEMGWSLDQRRLFIGNGTLEEGAPTQGTTEILTEYSDFLGFVSSYTFSGVDSGYTSQTGPNTLTPVTRSLQSVLDDIVTVRNFGAVGDAYPGNATPTDNTDALVRAIEQIYKDTLNDTYVNVQRTIKIPAGEYLITDTIYIPPNCTLVGDGKNNTIIRSTTGTVFQTADSLFQYGGDLGNNSAVMPNSIYISGMTLETTALQPVALVDTATDVIFDRVKFVGGTHGVKVIGNSDDIRVTNSTFTGQSIGPILIDDTATGVVSRTNYFDTVHVPLTTGITSVTTLATGAGVIEYEISDTSNNYRIGQMKYNNTGTRLTFDHDYSEPASALSANLFAAHNGTVTCEVTGTKTLKYNIKQFI